ncbi:unnamed protein product [Heterobilharzia americana]|nr:unnamed protein product [Heterobilharzia americana]
MTSLKLRYTQLCLCTLYSSLFLCGLLTPSFVNSLSLPFSSKQDVYKLLTFHMVTDEIVVFLMMLLTIFIYTKLVFDSWSKVEMAFFYWVVNMTSLFVFYLPYLFQFIGGFSVSIPQVNGGSAFISSVLVVIIQLRPEQPIINCKAFSMKSQYGLFLVLLVYCFLKVVGLIRLSSFVLFCNGVICSWCYLRLFQRHPQGRRGDYRSSFSFTRLFPEPIDKAISFPINICYQLLLRSKLFPSLRRNSEVTMASSFGLISHGLISPDSERHRRIALKALNERFMKSEGSASATSELPVWPNLVGSDETQKLEKGEPKESSVVIQLPTDVNPPKSSFTDSSSVCNPSTTGILSE